MIANPYHQWLLKEIKTRAGRAGNTCREDEATYVGTTQKVYRLKAKTKIEITKEFTRQNHQISLVKFLGLLDSLSLSESHEERNLRGRLLGQYPHLHPQIPLEKIDFWLGLTNGWAEVDNLCQGVFTGQELLARWSQWGQLLRQLNRNQNIHKRRASLVLLTAPVRQSTDNELAVLAFSNIQKLMAEKSILITKAISWLLRDLIKNHRQQVEEFLVRHQDTLPKIALRETRNKLLTGRKGYSQPFSSSTFFNGENQKATSGNKPTRTMAKLNERSAR